MQKKNIAEIIEAIEDEEEKIAWSARIHYGVLAYPTTGQAISTLYIASGALLLSSRLYL